MVTIDYYIQLCADVFGAEGFTQKSIQQRLNQTQMAYGGLNYTGSRVVFVNGDLDPW
jgi:hypothetical protein